MNILKWILDITIAYFFVLLPSMIIRSDLKFIFLLHSLNDTQVGNNYYVPTCITKRLQTMHDRKEEEEKTPHMLLTFYPIYYWLIGNEREEVWTTTRSSKKSNYDIISIFFLFILTSDMRIIHSFIFVHVRSVFDRLKTSIHQQHRWRKWILCDDGVSG